MKNVYRILVSIIALVAIQTAAWGQTGYSITDNNRDAAPNPDQQYYSFDLATGQGTLLAYLTSNGLPSSTGSSQIRREYEGMASSGSVLFGVTEFDTEVCNTGSDPLTGLAADLRIFRTAGSYPLANGVQSAIGPQIGETCFVAGFTESAAGYNAVDGFIYAITSDDLLPASAPRSVLWRVSPTTGLAVRVGTGAAVNGIILTTGSAGDQNPYLDGMTILPNGQAYATEARFDNNPVQSADPAVADNGGLYRVFLTGPNAGRATFVKYLLNADVNRDTGLANTASGTLYLLLEDARIWTTGVDAASAVIPSVFPLGSPAGSNTLSTPGCIRPTLPGGTFCGDFEGFDIPVPALR